MTGEEFAQMPRRCQKRTRQKRYLDRKVDGGPRQIDTRRDTRKGRIVAVQERNVPMTVRTSGQGENFATYYLLRT